MRTTSIFPILMLCLAGATAAQAPTTACASGVVRWSEGVQFAQGKLLALAAAGQPLSIHPDGWARGSVVVVDWGTPGLSCRIHSSPTVGRGSLGAVLGLFVGGFIGGKLNTPDKCNLTFERCFGSFSESMQRISIGMLVGGVSGAMIGVATAPKARWAPMTPLSSERRVGIAVTGNGVGVRIAF